MWQLTPHFDRLVIRTGDDLRAIIIEADGCDPVAHVRVLLLDDQSQGRSICAQAEGALRRQVALAKNGNSPHTLIVLSMEHETIWEACLLNATDVMALL